MVAEDGGRHKMTGHIRRNVRKSKGEDMIGTQKALEEEEVDVLG